MKALTIRIVLVCIGLLITTTTYALPNFLTTWQAKYPNSNSDDSGCQLCHKKPTGNDPWNAYGIRIRDALGFLNALDGASQAQLEEAFEFAEGDLDMNPDTPAALEEIMNHSQPGWMEGEVNTITAIIDDGSYAGEKMETFNQPPSSDLPCGVILDIGAEPFCSISNPQPSSIPRGNIIIDLETIASNFTAPVLAVSAPGESESIYVVEQGGRIQRVNLNTGAKELFLDFSSELVSDFGQASFQDFDERGLLGLAFHPDYESNNLIYTYLSKDYVEGAETLESTMPDGIEADHQAVISEWLVVNPQSSSPSAINEVELLIIDEPQFNHNGGTVEFGPDGYLYISLGDGGSSNDEGDGHGTNGNGRDNTNPLGTILRIDVDVVAPPNGRYGIPADNPFVGRGGLDEAYASGLRNPYRFSFEDLGNNEFNLYIGDVGQGALEEVNRLHSSARVGRRNFGWNYKEGTLFFDFDSNGNRFLSNVPPLGVTMPRLTDPIAEYDHDEGISVVGGHVYEGNEIETLQGKYVFGEWSRSFTTPRGRLFYLDGNDKMLEFIYQSPPNMFITGFGKDNQNELYVVGSQSFGVNSTTGVLKKVILGSPSDELCIPIKAQNGDISVICL